MPHQDTLVLLGIAHDELEVSIWRDILANEGIPVLAKTPDPFAAFGVPARKNSIRFFVSANDEKRARWLLGEAIGDPIPPDGTDAPEPRITHRHRVEDRSRAEP